MQFWSCKLVIILTNFNVNYISNDKWAKAGQFLCYPIFSDFQIFLNKWIFLVYVIWNILEEFLKFYKCKYFFLWPFTNYLGILTSSHDPCISKVCLNIFKSKWIKVCNLLVECFLELIIRTFWKIESVSKAFLFWYWQRPNFFFLGNKTFLFFKIGGLNF